MILKNTRNAARCSLREHWYKYIPKNLPQVSQKQIPIFILLDNFYFNNIAKKSFPGTKLGLVPDLVLRGTWTSPRCSWMSGNNLKSLFIWPLITFVFTTSSSQQVIPWDSPWSGPRPCSPRWLDLAQIVMDIWKQLKTTTIIIPNNFCFNNIAKNSFPGNTLGQVPDLAVWGGWTLPRWSWTSGKNLKQLLLSSPTTFLSTTLPKSQSLGLPLVRSQTSESEVPGPHPDGHGHPETT